MKRRHYFFVAILLIVSYGSNAQQYIVGTYNLRYANPHDSGNLWVDRAPVIASLIRFHDFDVLGTQEGLENQLEDLQADLPGYTRYGIGRDDGKNKGEHSAIFFKKDKFRLLKSGDFWLSPTPEKPGPGWDAHLNRICSWVELEDKHTKKRFYFFNAHFDHQGITARNESSKLVLEKMKAIAGSTPALFTGDLNGDNNSSWYKTLAHSSLLKDTYDEVKDPYANNGSFDGFGATVNRNNVIDHIFVTDGLTTKKWGILTDTYHGKYPSDHFPVLAVVQLR